MRDEQHFGSQTKKMRFTCARWYQDVLSRKGLCSLVNPQRHEKM
jgi:hypothetical protein